jgi:hypothetical protein
MAALDGCFGWLAGVGDHEDTELIPELKTSILQSSNDLVGFFPKDWDRSVILIFAVISLIIIEREGSLVV